jgi:hypothetical protein
MPIENPFKKLSKPEIYASIAGGLGIGGYFIYRHHSKTGSWNPWSSSTASAAASGGTGTDPITGLPYSQDDAVDPATGQTYLAEANQYGSVQAAEASISAYGTSTATGSGIPVNPASPASSGSINTPVGTSVYTSNAAWAQAATAGLESVGYDGTTVAAALGAYLTQTPLTADQATLVNTAIGEYGPAPVGSLQVILAPVSGPSTTPVPPAPTASAPKPSATWSSSIGASTTSNDLNVHWSAVDKATRYEVKFSNGWDNANITSTGGIFSIKSIGKSGTYQVRAGNSTGWSVWSASKSFAFPDKG